MGSSRISSATACLLGLPLLVSPASAQASAAGEVSTTPDNQVLVKLAPEDISAANPFDLSGRTVIFTPDGHGGYSRSVRSVAWEDDIGPAVADGAEIRLQSFTVDFAGRRWGSFFVSRLGLIAFGEPYEYSLPGYSPGFETMSEIAGQFVTAPTISPLFKPLLGGRDATQHVASSADRVVVTWITTEPHYYVYGVSPAKSSRFQLVLSAGGEITFSYVDVAIRDGIVGVFPNEEIERRDLIVGIADERADTALPGHLDLLNAAIYESNVPAKVIVEWTMREPARRPRAGTQNLYRLHFSAADDHFQWLVAVQDDGTHWTRGGERLQTADREKIMLLADIGDLNGLSARVSADVGEFTPSGDPLTTDGSREEQITLPTAFPKVDLSRPDGGFSRRQSEVFHYRGVPNLDEIACRVIDVLGDQFDLFTFHSEFRVDYQESASDWKRYREDITGVGDDLARRESSPCGEGRLKGHWKRPVWMKADSVFTDSRVRHGPAERTGYERGLLLFAHEFTHHWTAWASYTKGGQVESLAGDRCRCHWRWDLHVPAAFPWSDAELGPRSLMGGRYWRENNDGTFTPLDGYWGGGHSWLDLYAMGLAEAHEVPDMFILRNLRAVSDGDPRGPHTADKEIVTIDQVVAAEGPRVPGRGRGAQQDFNAGFVYLLEPGQTPDPEMLRLHAEYREKVIEHWSHITGGRSRMTTTVPVDDGPDDGGPTSPTEPGRTAPPTLDLACHGYDEGATRAYNCIPEPSQQRFMGTFVPAVGSACDRGSIAEFPPGRVVFQIRCRDGSPGQFAAWSYSGRGPASFVTPAGTSRVRIRTSFPGSSVRLSVWCRAPQEHLVVNELLGASWGNDGTSGIYRMAGCREVAVDTAREDLQWRFAQELAATALTPPRSWERVTGAGGDLSAEALQDLAAAAELERRWRRPGRSWMHPRPGASTRGAAPTADADGGARLDLRTASEPDDGTDALNWAPFRATTRTVPLTLDLTCHGYDEGATRAYNCIPEPSQQHHMRTFVPAVGSACDQGSIAEFPPGRIVFQIRCRDAGGGQSAAWSHSGLGPAFFEKPTDTPRVWVRTSFSGSSVGLSVWCRAPQEHLVVNELLGRSWGNDGTEGLYDLAGCREVEVDTAEGENVRWSFTEELAATALTPPRSWEQVSDTGMALPPEARQDLATAAELERLWPRPGR